MKRETQLHQKIIKWLNQNGWVAVKFPGTAFLRGWPDIIATKHGRSLFIEVKMPGKKPTKLQAMILDKLRTSGAKAIVADRIEDVYKAAGEIEADVRRAVIQASALSAITQAVADYFQEFPIQHDDECPEDESCECEHVQALLSAFAGRADLGIPCLLRGAA